MEAAHDALRELRSIQEQRIADEQAAVERARAAAEAVRAEGVRQRQESERAELLRREDAERAHALALARAEIEARVKAEHELAIIKTQADARARIELELASSRHAIELQPPAAIPRSRVAWVLGMALALAIVALGLAVHLVIERGDALASRTGELATANRRLDDLGLRIASIESKLRVSDQIATTKQRDLDSANAEIARLRAEAGARPSTRGPANTPVIPPRPHAATHHAPPNDVHPPLVIPKSCNTPGAAPLDCMPAK